MNEPTLDFRIVIGFSELCEKPFSLFTGGLSKNIESGMIALCRSRTGGPRHLLLYQRVLFPMTIHQSMPSRNDIVIQDIGLWDPVKRIQLGHWNVTYKRFYSTLKNEWYDKTFPEDKLQEIELILKNYIYNLEIPCTICSNFTPLHEISFYPFAGGACLTCKEQGKIPRVDTN